jgi:hypothetical protein
MNWQDTQVSLYSSLADNTGRPATLRDILFTDFALPHEWYFKHHGLNKWLSGNYNDLETIIDLRTREMSKEEKMMLKATLQCFTPAGLLKTKKQGQIEEISRSGLMQLDFDYNDIQDYDIEELKQAVFSLPFVAFCGLSCTGKGFYALVQIAEPERLKEYAEHCFVVLKDYGITADTSKGRNLNDLRFVSYDSNMLVRENPETLKIKQFKTKKTVQQKINSTAFPSRSSSNALVSSTLAKVRNAVEGNRWQTVQQAAFTLGGLQDEALLGDLQEMIKHSSQFAGLEEKYCKCAADCFNAGKNRPLSQLLTA